MLNIIMIGRKCKKNSYLRGDFMLNHIEYDEEEYNALLSSLNSISSDVTSGINSSCGEIKSIINDFYDNYSSSAIDGINNSLINHINQINNLQNTINYSLLAYQTCDKELEDVANRLIDQLFDNGEALLAKTFKNNVNKMTEIDSSNIMNYQENIDYQLVYEKLFPSHQYTDKDGNILYFNSKNVLIGTSNDNVKIMYGGEEFSVHFLENGALQLLDSNNKPISIFGDYNIDSKQYGSDQNSFQDNLDKLINDENIVNILNQYIPNDNLDLKKKYLVSIARSGCGYGSIANAVFNELTGHEDVFLDTFGYPMYNVKMNNEGIPNVVDFNYEPVLLDIYSFKIDPKYRYFESVEKVITEDEGVFSKSVPQIFNRFNDKYHLFQDNYETVLERNGYYSDRDFNMYYLDGSPYYIGAGGHVMTKVAELDDKRWIVSSYGQKLISEINKPNLDWHYVSED